MKEKKKKITKRKKQEDKHFQLLLFEGGITPFELCYKCRGRAWAGCRPGVTPLKKKSIVMTISKIYWHTTEELLKVTAKKTIAPSSRMEPNDAMMEKKATGSEQYCKTGEKQSKVNCNLVLLSSFGENTIRFE